MRNQTELNLFKGKHGGRRPGCGRKRIKSKGVAHRTRAKIVRKTPMHINFKFKITIRNKEALKLLKRAIINSRGHGLRIIHYSLQSNHIHLIVEADDNKTLTKGMRSLTITFAKGLKRGRIQIERYHLHVLRNLKEAHNAIKYVLLNEQKHTNSKRLIVDGYSSLKCLGIDFVRKLVKENRMSLIWDTCEEISFLSTPSSWFLKSYSTS